MRKIKITDLPIYPFLLGLFPVLYLWNANRTQQPAYVVIPPLFVTLISLLVIFLIAFATLRNTHRAALFTALLSFYLLTYGQFTGFAKSWSPVAQRFLLVGTFVLVIVLLAVIVARKLGGPALTRTLNLISAFLVVFQIASATPYYIRYARLQTSAGNSGAQQASLIPVTGQPQRDIYFILVDNYSRQDILQQVYNYDNTPLVDALKQRGFIFPDCAQSNYSSTAPVIASILNMNYLDTFGIKDISFSVRGHYDDLAPLILDSKVIQQFHNMGYQVVTFRGFQGLIDIHKNVDHYISYDQDKAYTDRLETIKFRDLYFQTTIFSSINDDFKIYPDLVSKIAPSSLKPVLFPDNKLPVPEEFWQVYQQNLYSFNALKNIPLQVASPKFVYAHVYTAHWPWMMKPDGSLRLPFSEVETKEAYVDGVKYSNSQLIGAIDSILKNSKVPPVIILQGDHSDVWTPPVEWSGKDRMKILSAYYLPDGGDKMLYDTITPVNNFRLIFQKYFGLNYPLLPDVSHYLDPSNKKIETTPPTCISTGGQPKAGK